MYKYKFSDIGEGIQEGKILEWVVEKGDEVEDGDTLVVVETDKINAELPAPVDGTIVKLAVEEGDTVEVGDLLVVIDDGEDTKDGDTDEDEGQSEGNDEDQTEESEEESDENKDEDKGGVVGELEESDDVIAPSEESSGSDEKSSRTPATPAARKFASDNDIDLKDVDATGEDGRVLKADIVDHLAQSHQTEGETEVSVETRQNDRREEISSLRKTIVDTMSTSKRVIPHSTLMDDVVVDDLVKLRNEHKEDAKKDGVKLTYLPFIIKALSKTIEKYPKFNASFDHGNKQIIYRAHQHVGIAVDTDNGLIVPNIKDADTLGIYPLANEIERLATLSQNRKIQMDDLRGGTISITNFGALGSKTGTPIIKHPEVAILGIGKIEKKPIVRDDEIVAAYVLPLSVTFDHRIIDGADAGRFMNTLKNHLMNPMQLLFS